MKRRTLLVAFAAGPGALAARAAERVWRSPAREGELPEYTNTPAGEGAALVMVFAAPPPRPAVYAEVDDWRATRSRLDPTMVHPSGGVNAVIRLAASTYRVDEPLLRALIHVESGFDPRARSSAGAVGLMQLMPGTAERYGAADRNDMLQNVDAGTRYLKDLLQRFGNDLPLALAAYNAGPGAVLRHGGRIPPYPQTQAYVPAVLAQYRRYALAR